MSSDKPKVVRVGVYPHRVDETVGYEAAAFDAAGVDYVRMDASDVAAVHASIADADAVIVGGGNWDSSAFDSMRRCKLLLNCGVGLDRVDVDAATRRGVMVCNMPDICTDEVADHALALMLACNRRIVRLHNRVAGGTWDRLDLEPMPRLRGQSVGLLGFGRIARAVAERCQAFGMAVRAYDPLVPASLGRKHDVELVELDDLLEESDVVSCHLPHLPSTHHLMDEGQFQRMLPSAYFINTSRGRVVDEAALILALQEGWIAGAGLDVLEDEPPSPDNPLLHMPNVIVTPHAAGFSDEVVDEIPRLAVREVLAVLGGGRPRAIAWANRAAFAVAAAR